MAVKVQSVRAGSVAARRGVLAGDVLCKVNGNEIVDVLDYQFYIAESTLKLLLRRGDRHLALKVRKAQYEDLGLDFETYLMDQQRSCTNDCIFCFVHQMPPGMRESLYFKDDDARLSFLLGNYITLTNLKPDEIQRIIQMHISPINVSVHTTNPELRCSMMKNRFAGERLSYLRELAAGGIDLNAQLVLCPGINDGEELKRTLEDLAKLYPRLQSIACVPVGLTKYRDTLATLEGYNQETAGAVLDLVEAFAADFYRENGTRLAYASDEFYLRANRPLPLFDCYEDFAQLENGVGVLATLQADFDEQFAQWEADDKERTLSIATGVDAAPFIQALVDKAAKKWHNLKCTVYAIRNDFFGERITVAGLVTATDIIAQLQGKELGDTLILPNCMLRHEQDKFLDDLTVADVEQALGVTVRLSEPSGDGLLSALLLTETCF